MSLTVGSLFTGIGGIDLGLERAGMDIRWQCEIDPYCRRVLDKHWPDVPCYDDVRNLPDDIEPVDLVCGGYPCQPFSLAGQRGGADDPRHLWPSFADTLRLLRPEWALLENVPGHLSLGFGDVLGDLAALGYDAEWGCVPAAAVGAPHLRWRLFVVAHTQGYPGRVGHRNSQENVHGADVQGLERRKRRIEWSDPERPPATPVGPGSSRSGWWDVEPDVGRVAHGVPSRVDRLRALGNAVVPQVAELVGRRILSQISGVAKP